MIKDALVYLNETDNFLVIAWLIGMYLRGRGKR